MSIPESNEGYCHCCRSRTVFEVQGPWLRDQYLCERCGSIPRQRHLFHLLDTLFPCWEDLQIHESSPSADYFIRHTSRYSSSQYLEGIERGATHGGVRCEDLEQLTFADRTFDLFVTQDVLEHVFDPRQALREVQRVLKPGGAHVFTTPKHRHIATSEPRSVKVNGEVRDLKERQYHGNPVGDGRALVTWDFGRDFEFLMANWTSAPVATFVTRDRQLGIDGEYLEVFILRRRD